MTKRIKKGYEWVEEQEEIWEAISAEKKEQIDKLSRSHLNWFKTHSTVSDLLKWKRSKFGSSKKCLPRGTPPTILPTVTEPASVVEETITIDLIPKPTALNKSIQEPKNPLRKSDDEKRNHDASSSLEEKTIAVIANEDINTQFVKNTTEKHSDEKLEITQHRKASTTTKSNLLAVEEPLTPEIIMTLGRCSSTSRDSEKDDAMSTPDLIVDTFSQQTQTQPAPATPEHYIQMETEDQDDVIMSKKPQLKNTHVVDTGNIEPSRIVKIENEYEDEDEIQLVVSNRNFQKEFLQKEKSITPSPSRSTPAQAMISPPGAAIPKAETTTPVLPKSSFMRRLFQITTTLATTRDRVTNHDAPLNFVTVRGRSSTSTINTEASNHEIMSLLDNDKKRPFEATQSDIEISDIMPQTRSKKPKILDNKMTVSVPKQLSKADQAEGPKESEKEKPYDIPSWALNPELVTHLKYQAGLDPEKIFGRMAPLKIEEIFARSHLYMT